MKCPYCENPVTISYFSSKLPGILSACPKEKLLLVRTCPIEVRLCTACGLGFNATRLTGEELKSIYENYLYISPAQNIGKTIYRDMAEYVGRYCRPKDEIVEIGCSEGFLLQELKRSGFSRLTGIEPGPQAEIARNSGIRIIKAYFEESTLPAGSVDVFLLTHVFEHFDNPFAMLDTMKKQLAPGGRIIIIVPDFGGYHHQHLFYYNTFFFHRMCRDHGLEIAAISIDGAELRCVITRLQEIQGAAAPLDNLTIEDIILRAGGIQDDFDRKIQKVDELLTTNPGTVYWWGAGSASTIVLNQVQKDLLSPERIFVIDSDPSKRGYIIPGTLLEVRTPDELAGSRPSLVIIASSLFQEIEATMQQKNIRPAQVEIVY